MQVYKPQFEIRKSRIQELSGTYTAKPGLISAVNSTSSTGAHGGWAKAIRIQKLGCHYHTALDRHACGFP